MLGRRKFLGTLAAGMAATIVPAGVISAAGLATLREQFDELVECNFHLLDSAGAVRKARLVTLDDGPECPGLEQFSVVFEGEGLNDGVYDVYHPNVGTLTLGLMETGDPGAALARQRAYFATFA